MISSGLFYISSFFKTEVSTKAELLDLNAKYDDALIKLGVIGNINYVISLVSIIAVIYQISRPGTSRDLKSKVYRRYFSYLCLFLLWIVNFTYDFFQSFNVILMQMGALLGIPLALVRLLEPLVWQEFKKNVFCMKQKTQISKE